MGGNRNRKEAKLRANCEHEATLSTITAGIERTVCEACGHLTMRHVAVACSPVDRATFAREIDEKHAEADAAIIDLTEATTTSVHPFAPVVEAAPRTGITVKGIVEELNSETSDESWHSAAGGRSAYRVARSHKVPVGA